ncbi:olfactory receptor 11L1-like [Rana temporaria]|uniref:olfactory receptor 11L1-like n=1 Tax=Rana temporaria TaxID=8407 RepID=UPI001AAD79AA|nr:olfactory receptor 11L1-like [Rana temporaria]
MNTSLSMGFILLGFQELYGLQNYLFTFFLLIYVMTICGNLLIITLVVNTKNLQTPMYFFLTLLSLSDLILSTNIVPKMLHVVVNVRTYISFVGCITQFYFFSFSECLECLLLTVMSYDRYLAICNPLNYISIMNNILCKNLIVTCWMLSISISFINALSLGLLEFCGSNIIDHFFCDYSPLIELSCSETSLVQLEVTLLSFPVLVIPFIIITFSYIHIIKIILRIPSNTGRQKAFSTCSSHLTVVSTYYVTLISMYGFPIKGQSLKISKVLSLLYTVGTPLMNPVIYSLRNKDIKNAFRKNYQMFCRIVS